MTAAEAKRIELREKVEKMAWKCAWEGTHTDGELREAWDAGYTAMYRLYQLLAP